jgi:hypothetical protein
LASISSDGILTAKKDGKVTVTCKTNDGGFTASIMITISKQVGINDLSLISFRVYPIPATNTLTIENELSALQYEIVDMNGKVLMVIQNPENETNIEIGNFKKGFYMIRAYFQNTVLSRKFIK